MSKRKPAKRKAAPRLVANPFRGPMELPTKGRTFVTDAENGGFRKATPADYAGRRRPFRELPPHLHFVTREGVKGGLWSRITTVYGVPLPPDFEEAVEYYAGDSLRFTASHLVEDAELSPAQWKLIRCALECCFRTGFLLAAGHYSADLTLAAEARPLFEQRKEHGELLAAEGRAAKAANDKRRADLICRLYRAVRPSSPDGRKGNGEAHRVVAKRYEMQTGETVTVRTIRNTVAKAGRSAPRPRKGKD